MKVLILAGGAGTRLWPLSRTYYPKQFLKLKNSDKSIFQRAFTRSLELADLDRVYIVTNVDYKFLVLGQIEELGFVFNDEQILIEPVGRNTLPAIYYGVKEFRKGGEDVVAVFPADHLIENEKEFIRVIKEGESLTNGHIVTFGICPLGPHTGYGYIKPGALLGVGSIVAEFKEKPDEETARAYIDNGYLWNSGMFMFRTDIFEEEIKMYAPDVHGAFSSEDISEAFKRTPSISVDYGLMEKSGRVAVIPMDVKWSDLGSFDSFYDEFTADERGNIKFNDDIIIDSSNNLLYTNRDKVAALIGVEDLIVVDEKDALLICKKQKSQTVKDVVNRLKLTKNPRLDYHLTNYRPWGSYTILEEGAFYKIKRITVLPGKKLSVQLHHHRSEHWVVVKGMAKVYVEDREYFVRSGESTYVQSGLKHRLENTGKVLLEVIEVQLGEYLEEDDIVRFLDSYGRC